MKILFSAFPFTVTIEYTIINLRIVYFLRGQVKFLTGGDEALLLSP
jgi:hypothetical protein